MKQKSRFVSLFQYMVTSNDASDWLVFRGLCKCQACRIKYQKKGEQMLEISSNMRVEKE